MFRWRRQNKRSDRTSQKQEAEQLEIGALPDFKTSGSGAKIRSEVSSRARRPIEAMVWINEIESAKSVADLKTSCSITRIELQTKFEVLVVIGSPREVIPAHCRLISI